MIGPPPCCRPGTSSQPRSGAAHAPLRAANAPPRRAWATRRLERQVTGRCVVDRPVCSLTHTTCGRIGVALRPHGAAPPIVSLSPCACHGDHDGNTRSYSTARDLIVRRDRSRHYPAGWNAVPRHSGQWPLLWRRCVASTALLHDDRVFVRRGRATYRPAATVHIGALGSTDRGDGRKSVRALVVRPTDERCSLSESSGS